MIEQLTPKQKAKELIEKWMNLQIKIGGVYDGYISMNIHQAKESAIITVNEILFAYPHTYDLEIEYTRDGDEIKVIKNVRGNIEYWQEVKQEIINYQE